MPARTSGRGHDDPPLPGAARGESSGSLIPESRPGPGPDGITPPARLVAGRRRALDHQSDVPDRQHRRGEHCVLIHVFQVEIPEPRVGAHQLVQPMDLGVGDRPVTPTGEQAMPFVV